ncbi:MAG: hypothetical protein IIA72_15550 [Proteobacteria bacterium]|nr:hypothetical protein [Pseudomonadota bacterium]
MILVIGPRLEGHSVLFLAIQTHLSCRVLLAVDSLGLRRSGSWSQFIDPPRDFPKQVPGNGDLGQLERDVPAMADIFGPDLDELLSQRSAANSLLPPIRLTSPLGHNRKSVTATRMSAFGGKAEVDFGRLDVCL